MMAVAETQVVYLFITQVSVVLHNDILHRDVIETKEAQSTLLSCDQLDQYHPPHPEAALIGTEMRRLGSEVECGWKPQNLEGVLSRYWRFSFLTQCLDKWFAALLSHRCKIKMEDTSPLSITAQNETFHGFWTSPSCTVDVIAVCAVVNRNWKIEHFLQSLPSNLFLFRVAGRIYLRSTLTYPECCHK